MANFGKVIGIDPSIDKTWEMRIRAHKLMMPRALGVNAANVATRTILWVKADRTIHPTPMSMDEVKEGVMVGVAAIREVPEHTRWSKFRGFQTEAESTAGRCFLFGYSFDGKVVDCPISLEWVRKFIDFGPETAENGAETAL